MSTPIAIYWKETSPQIGSYISADTWEGHRNSNGYNLIDSEWDKADFRLSMAYDIAVNIEVTGRVVYNDGWIRIKIEFVGDGEPSEFVKGWMRTQ